MTVPPPLRARWLAVASAALTLGIAQPASADHPERDKYVPHPVRSDYTLETWWWSRTGGSTFPFVLSGRNEAAENLFIDFELPWTFTAHTDGVPIPDDENGIATPAAIGALGNPALFLRYADRRDAFAWTVGGGVAAPMGAIDELPFRLAQFYGGAAMGLYNAYLWLPEVVPVIVRGGLEVRLAEPLFLRAELDPMFFIPIEGDFEVATQERVELEARVPRGVGGGVGLQALTGLTETDITQVSTDAFFSYDDEEDFFFRLGVLLALDEPFGFGFDTGGVFSGYMLLGGYFEEDDEW